MVETVLAVLVRRLATDGLEYYPIHPAFNALILILYPLAGAVLGTVVALLTRGRLVRTAGLVVLPLALAASAAWTGDFGSWTAFMILLGTVVGVLVAAAELWPSRLGWAANAWWVAAVVAGAPFLQHEIGAGLGRMARMALTLGVPAAATVIAVLLWLRFRRPLPASRRAVLAGALAVLTLLAALLPRQTVRSQPLTAGGDPGPRPNVVLITLDTTRADHLSLYGYQRKTTPNLDRLAAESVLYQHPVAPSEMTLPSHASIFTGLYATRHGAHFSRDYRYGRPLETPYPTLAEILRDHGYYTAGVAANTVYLRRNYRLDRGFLYWDNRWPLDFLVDMAGVWLRQLTINSIKLLVPRQNYGHAYRQATAITDTAIEVLDRARLQRRPFFLFLNYMDAHFPCAPPGRYRDAFPGRDPSFTQARYLDLRRNVLRARRQVTPAELRHLDSQYDGGILYMDAELNRLFARLRALGLYDNTLIIVTADHGEAFGERHYFEHASMAVYQFLVGVPLLVRYPQGARQGVVREPVSLVDILPTTLDVLGYTAPAALDGYSLLRPAPPSARVLAEMFPGMDAAEYGPRYARHQRAYYSGPMKFIQATDGSRELYDIYGDPRELHDLYPSDPDASRPLQAGLEGWLAKYLPHGGAAAPTAATRYDLDRLRSLGYVQ